MSKKKLIVLGSVIAAAVSAAIIVMKEMKKPKKLFRDVDLDKFDSDSDEQSEEEIDMEFEELEKAARADCNRFAEIVMITPSILTSLLEVSGTGKVEATMPNEKRVKFDEAVGIISRRPSVVDELVYELFKIVDIKANAMDVIHKYIRKDESNMTEKEKSVLNRFKRLITSAKEETELCSSGDLDNYQVALHLIDCSNQIAAFFKANFMFFVPVGSGKDSNDEYLESLRKVSKDLVNTDYRPFKELDNPVKEVKTNIYDKVKLNGEPITLTREEAIKLHRETWNWIAKEEAAYKNGEETFKGFKIPEGLTADEVFEERCLLKEMWLENKGYSGLINDCFLCTWASSNQPGFYCDSCPLNWSKTPDSDVIRCCSGHISNNSYEWDDQEVDASIIANLPEIVEE